MPADGSERPRWAEASATTLENEHVALRPVSAADRAALHAIAMDPQIWQYFVSRVDTDEQFEAFFDAMIADHAERRRAVFCVHDKASSRLCGSMSFGNMSRRSAPGDRLVLARRRLPWPRNQPVGEIPAAGACLRGPRGGACGV